MQHSILAAVPCARARNRDGTGSLASSEQAFDIGELEFDIGGTTMIALTG
jgi:hypothetical protein